MAWASLCKPRSQGGLGFKQFEHFNEAMLAKLAWWVLSDRDSFYMKVLKAKYKVGNNWLRCRTTKVASFVWKGLENSRVLLTRGACRMVGSGLSTLVWEDPWVPDLPSFIPKPCEPTDFLPSLVVAQFIDHDRND